MRDGADPQQLRSGCHGRLRPQLHIRSRCANRHGVPCVQCLLWTCLNRRRHGRQRQSHRRATLRPDQTYEQGECHTPADGGWRFGDLHQRRRPRAHGRNRHYLQRRDIRRRLGRVPRVPRQEPGPDSDHAIRVRGFRLQPQSVVRAMAQRSIRCILHSSKWQPDYQARKVRS